MEFEMSERAVTRGLHKYQNETGWVVSITDSIDESRNFSYSGLSKEAADLIFDVEYSSVNKGLTPLDPNSEWGIAITKSLDRMGL
jgi:hypothetical protein